jgi:hypothetical protein
MRPRKETTRKVSRKARDRTDRPTGRRDETGNGTVPLGSPPRTVPSGTIGDRVARIARGTIVRAPAARLRAPRAVKGKTGTTAPSRVTAPTPGTAAAARRGKSAGRCVRIAGNVRSRSESRP